MIRDFHRAFVVIQMVSRLNLDGNAKRRRFQVTLSAKEQPFRYGRARICGLTMATYLFKGYGVSKKESLLVVAVRESPTCLSNFLYSHGFCA